MHVGRSKVDYNLSSGNPESHGLQCRDGPEQAFLDCGIGKPDQMYPEAVGNVHFDCYRNGFYSDTFGAMNVYYHDLYAFCH